VSAYVLDAFAIMAFFKNEPGRARVEGLFNRASAGMDSLFVTVVNLGEAYYKLRQNLGEAFADQALVRFAQIDIDVVDVDRDLTLQAAYTKADRRLGYMDCFAFALAKRLEATVVTGDDDFRRVEDLVAIDWLPHPNHP